MTIQIPRCQVQGTPPANDTDYSALSIISFLDALSPAWYAEQVKLRDTSLTRFE
jgi:hypothetical protein